MGKYKEMVLETKERLEKLGYYKKDLRRKEEDPVKFEVLYTKLVQCVLTARETATLISANPVTREAGDTVFGLYTPEGDSICLTAGVLVHVHTTGLFIKWMLEHDYEEKMGIKEGDYFFNNDSYIGGAHSNDQNIVTPIFYKGELVGWAGGMTHVPETGATEPGGFPSSAISRFDEGLYIPCMKIAEDEKVRPDLDLLVERNVRMPVYWLLDNRAKMAGVRIMRERVKSLIDEYGADYFKDAVHEYIEDTIRATKEKARRVLFPGKYRAVAFYDVTLASQPVRAGDTLEHLPLEMTVDKKGNITLDFDGLSSPGQHPANSSHMCSEGNVFCAFLQNLFYDSRYNEGTAIAVDMNIPLGTVCNPENIFYATNMWMPGYMLGSACWCNAVARAYYARGYREEVHASNPIPPGTTSGGTDQYGRQFGGLYTECTCPGQGALAIMDGLDYAYAHFNPEADMADVEALEQQYPAVYLGRSIHIDSGGFGKYRGGNGNLTLRFVENTPFLQMGSFAGGTRVHTTPGIMGGYPSATEYKNIARNTNLKDLIDKKAPLPHREGADPSNPEMMQLLKADFEFGLDVNYVSREIKKYSIYQHQLLGGGGFGDPIERDPKLVARDLEDESITLRTAKAIYCVDIDPETLEIDYEKTEKLREEMREARKKRMIPVKEYIKHEREKISKGNIPKISKEMYNDVLAKSEKFAKEFREFWNLPDDFVKIPE